MSIKVMTKVWSDSIQKGSALLLLLAVADFADERGMAWPSIETLARKSRTSERTVQRTLKKMVESGELRVWKHEGRMGTNMYQITIGGDKLTPPGVTNEVKGGDKQGNGGDTTMTPEPSFKATVIKQPLVKNKEIVPIPPELAVPNFFYAWSEWLAYRKEIKKPLTNRSIKMQFKKLVAVGPNRAVELIEESIGNGWIGLGPWKNRGKKNDGQPAAMGAIRRAREELENKGGHSGGE